jgi:hypothetical protein
VKKSSLTDDGIKIKIFIKIFFFFFWIAKDHPIHKIGPDPPPRWQGLFTIIRYIFEGRKMLNLQYQHNNHTTTSHMRVNPTHWGPLSCEGLLCGCCDGVVYESNPG